MQKATFDHIAVFVANLQRSIDFYQKIIGLDPIPDPFKDDTHKWLKTGPGNAIHIIEGAKKEKEYFKSNHICFRVASLEVFIAMLNEMGIAFEDADGTKNNQVNIRPDGVKQIWLQDPDGYWIEINDAKE